MGIRALSLGVKWQRREADYSFQLASKSGMVVLYLFNKITIRSLGNKILLSLLPLIVNNIRKF
jgi:hypothetical protein